MRKTTAYYRLHRRCVNYPHCQVWVRKDRTTCQACLDLEAEVAAACAEKSSKSARKVLPEGRNGL